MADTLKLCSSGSGSAAASYASAVSQLLAFSDAHAGRLAVKRSTCGCNHGGIA